MKDGETITESEGDRQRGADLSTVIRMGAAGHYYTGLLLLCTGLLSISEAQNALCPNPVIPPNSKVFPFGSNATLTCPGCDGRVTWTCFHRLQSYTVKTETGELALKSIRYKDVGNYTCASGGQQVCSVQLLVSAELEQPIIQCTLRHPASNIICEWTPQKKLPSDTETVLKVQLRIDSPPVVWPCSYKSSAKRFSCRVKYKEEDSSKFMIAMCVTSRTSSRGSDTIMTEPLKLLCPDPPVSVTVSPVEGAPTKLRVSWLYPPTWDDTYYKLFFEVHYRAENSNLNMTMPPTVETFFHIDDAWMDRKHLVMVRAQEEFRHGTWSSWSRVAEGTPWSDPSRQTLPTEMLSTEDSREYYSDIYSSRKSSSEEIDDYGAPSVQHYRGPRFLVAGAGLALIIVLFIGIVLRHSQWRRRGVAAGGKLCFLFLPSRSEPQSNHPLPMTSSCLPITEKHCASTIKPGD